MKSSYGYGKKLHRKYFEVASRSGRRRWYSSRVARSVGHVSEHYPSVLTTCSTPLPPVAGCWSTERLKLRHSCLNLNLHRSHPKSVLVVVPASISRFKGTQKHHPEFISWVISW